MLDISLNSLTILSFRIVRVERTLTLTPAVVALAPIQAGTLLLHRVVSNLANRKTTLKPACRGILVTGIILSVIENEGL